MSNYGIWLSFIRFSPFFQWNMLFFPGSLTRVCHPGIISNLLNTGETPSQKVSPLRSFEPKLSLSLVRSSFSPEYLMKAMFGLARAVKDVMRGVYHE